MILLAAFFWVHWECIKGELEMDEIGGWETRQEAVGVTMKENFSPFSVSFL